MGPCGAKLPKGMYPDILEGGGCVVCNKCAFEAKTIDKFISAQNKMQKDFQAFTNRLYTKKELARRTKLDNSNSQWTKADRTWYENTNKRIHGLPEFKKRYAQYIKDSQKASEVYQKEFEKQVTSCAAKL